MSAALVNLTVEQGAYWDQQFLWKDSNGDPVDLSGYTAANMQVRDNDVAQGDPIIELTVANGGIVLGGTAGTIDLILTTAQTTALDVLGSRSWMYDLFLTPASGEVVKLVRGQFNVVEAVTR